QSGVGVVGREFVEGYGGRVALAPVVRGLSTSERVARVLRAFGQAPRRG
ncbi:MAG: hypothetical protein HZA54_01610, partial [Planctomycetes bacterium]|nr:hypothetical protein [Planctomycetota bacterium]